MTYNRRNLLDRLPPFDRMSNDGEWEWAIREWSVHGRRPPLRSRPRAQLAHALRRTWRQLSVGKQQGPTLVNKFSQSLLTVSSYVASHPGRFSSTTLSVRLNLFTRSLILTCSGGIYVSQKQPQDSGDHFCLVVLLLNFGCIGHGFYHPDMVTALVALAEKKKTKPSDLSWRHLRARRATKSRQTHLTQQP
ncbi:hypothetical protein TNCV_2394391 [Trichonephila clavipes]|nr:hypothetical protein TNCV_2394391 [Trichonephila clavipes]